MREWYHNFSNDILGTLLSKMKKLLKISVLIVFAVLACSYRGGKASAATDGPFTCSSNFYQVISGQLESLNPVTSMYTDIGSYAGFNYNAMGYNILDNYLYAVIVSGPNVGDLIRVGNDGTTTDLGVPTSLPASGYDNASFDLAGNMYIRSSVNNHTIYEINVGTNPTSASSMTVTTLNITGSGGIVAGADSVIVDNNYYTLLGDSLSIVNLSNDTVTTTTVSGLSTSDSFGAAWVDQSGDIFFSDNTTGSIYQILDYTSNSPNANFEIKGDPTMSNDGASCPLAAQSPFDPPTAVNDSYSTPFDTPLNETVASLLSNDAGNSLTVTSNTNPSHGTVTVNPNGTFLYTPDPGFSGTDSFNYTVTDSFGRTASATATITVSKTKAVVQTPDTGYGTPVSSSRVPIGVTSISLVVISTGLRLLYGHNRRTRRYIA